MKQEINKGIKICIKDLVLYYCEEEERLSYSGHGGRERGKVVGHVAQQSSYSKFSAT